VSQQEREQIRTGPPGVDAEEDVVASEPRHRQIALDYIVETELQDDQVGVQRQPIEPQVARLLKRRIARDAGVDHLIDPARIPSSQPLLKPLRVERSDVHHPVPPGDRVAQHEDLDVGVSLVGRVSETQLIGLERPSGSGRKAPDEIGIGDRKARDRATDVPLGKQPADGFRRHGEQQKRDEGIDRLASSRYVERRRVGLGHLCVASSTSSSGAEAREITEPPWPVPLPHGLSKVAVPLGRGVARSGLPREYPVDLEMIQELEESSLETPFRRADDGPTSAQSR
jgi:hypothetical protein